MRSHPCAGAARAATLCAVIPAEPALTSWWSRGLPATELLCEQQPEWAVFATEALAATPLRPSLPTGHLPGTTGFRTVFAPFAELAGARLAAAAPEADVDLPAIRSALTGRLAEILARQAARTLVLELNVARVTGKLPGATPSERFRDFIALTARQEGLTALLHEYPVLARLAAQTCVDAAESVAELLHRFAADRAELVRTLFRGTDPGTLTGLRLTAGDGHRGGRTVAVLRFADDARVVYKPRPLRVHRHFNEAVDWLNAQPGSPGLRTLALLERPEYGWLEFVTARPCTDPGQVRRFYRRQGTWLALLYALDCTDLHFENLIACAEEPVPVDIETLFHPPAPAKTTPDGAKGADEDPAAQVLEASVYRIGLLPRLLLGDETAVDASGLGGDAGARSPMPGIGWEGAGTDEMRLVRQSASFVGAENRPSLDGGYPDPADHTETLVAGFRDGYRAITAGRDELLGPDGLLRRFADDEVRVVVRATQSYATLLDESTHPDVLRDPAEREQILRLLETDELGEPLWPRLVDWEVAELWDGDIPMFTARPGSADLWSGTGERIPDALERPGLDRVADKILAMGPADLVEQEWVIRAAMAGRSTEPAHQAATLPPAPLGTDPANAAAPADPARLLAAARAIGDQLVEHAHRSESGDRRRDRQRVNWLGLELLADQYWRVVPSGGDLGSGYPGPALFLAQLAALTGSARYADTARSALRPVPGLLDRLAAGPEELDAVGSGAFAGLGGITYTLTQVATLLDDPEIRSWIEPATRLTVAAAEAEAETDGPSGIVEGTAGGLATLLAVHRATGSSEAWFGARLCADRLADCPLPAAAGFAGGAAGVGWALLGFAEAGGGDDYRTAGLAALRASAHAALPSAPGPAWCEGLPGIALAIADRAAALADPELAAFVQQAASAVVDGGPPANHSLCHGETGSLELLGRLPDAAFRAARDSRASALTTLLEQSGPRCGTPDCLPAPGLLTGLSGIGHGLLRLGFPEHTASVLLLQPPAPVRPSLQTP